MTLMLQGAVAAGGPEVLVPGDGATDWENVANCATSLGEIEKTGGSAWTGTGSFGPIPANTDGFIVFKFLNVATSRKTMAGLSTDPAAGASFTNIDLSIAGNGTILSAREFGTLVGLNGNESAITLTQEFKIERVYDGPDSTLNVYQDGTLVLSRALSGGPALYFDCSMAQNGTGLTGVSMEHD